MVRDPDGFSRSGSTWIGHRRGTASYARIQIAMLLAGIATFAQLYAPQAALPAISAAFNVDIASAALVVSAATLGLAVGTLPWTIVADRYGRKRTISIAITAATLFGIASTLMPVFELTLATRLLEGLALGGVPAVAMAYINEEIHRSDAAGAAGTFIAGTTIGGLYGRLVAGPLSEAVSWQAGFLVVSATAIVCAIVFVLLTPQPFGFVPSIGTGSSLANAIANAASSIGNHFRDPVLLTLYLASFTTMGGFVAVYNYLGHYLIHEPFFLPPWVATSVFLAFLAATITSPAAGRLAGAFGRKSVLLCALALALAGLTAMAFEHLVAVISGLIIFTGAFFAAHSVASGWAGGHPSSGRAQSTGLYNVWYYAGSSVFGFLGGLVYQEWGWVALILSVGGLYAVALIAGWGVLPRTTARA